MLLLAKKLHSRNLYILKYKKSKMFHSKGIKEPAKNEAISGNVMLRMPENVHT